MQPHPDIESKDNLSTPRFLYKYRSLGDFTNKILRNNELYYSRPNRFNDPFDCHLRLDDKISSDDLTHFFRHYQPEMQRHERKRQVKELMKNPMYITEIVNSVASEALSNCGVCCLAERPDDILMWSHYSDSHSGLCIKFDSQADEHTFSKALKVHYQEEYPSINYYKNQILAINQLMSTKSSKWSYEQEWRLIKYNSSGTHKFNKYSLVEIIFGCKSPKKAINDTRTLLDQADMNHVTFKQAKISKTKFSLDLIDL